MKRTPLRRTSISRRPAKRRRYADAEAMQTFREEHLSCAACWIPTWKSWGGLHLHHVLNGAYCRKDHPANALMLCPPCHERLDTGCVGVCLTLKMEDTATWDREWLASWCKRFKRILPPAEPLCPWILEARARWTQ